MQRWMAARATAHHPTKAPADSELQVLAGRAGTLEETERAARPAATARRLSGQQRRARTLCRRPLPGRRGPRCLDTTPPRTAPAGHRPARQGWGGATAGVTALIGCHGGVVQW